MISFAGTITLGCISVYQTRRAYKISERSLNIEESKSIPSVMITEVKDGIRELSNEMLNKGLNLTVNDSYCMIDEENNVEKIPNDHDVLLFYIANISSTYITSLDVKSIKYTVNTKTESLEEAKGFSRNRSLVLSLKESAPFIVTVPHPIQCGNSLLKITIEFLIANNVCEKFVESITLQYVAVNEEKGFLLPQIFERKIEDIKKYEE